MFFFRKKSFLSGEPPLRRRRRSPEGSRLYGLCNAGTDTPIAQFMASYKLGDDLFDDSFSIDSPSGEFLGECGSGSLKRSASGDLRR